MNGNFLQPPSIASSTKASRVPEVGGGPNTSIFLAGSTGLTSFQVLYGLSISSSLPFGFGTDLASARKISLRDTSNCFSALVFARTIPS